MPLAALDMAQMDAMWRVNVRAPFELTHRLLPLLINGGASIIRVTSIHDTMPYPNNATHSAQHSTRTAVTCKALFTTGQTPSNVGATMRTDAPEKAALRGLTAAQQDISGGAVRQNPV